jgi:hypothetical protein
MELNTRETALVLAGLRLLQTYYVESHRLHNGGVPASVYDILVDADMECAPASRIDRLCEKINLSGDPLAPLHYVRDVDGDQDLLVRAGSVPEVLLLWRQHFECGAKENPTYIGVVPPLQTGALDWGKMQDGAVHYKPMPE